MGELQALRLIHVVCGTIWVGAGVFAYAFLDPLLRRLGPTGAPVVRGLRRRGLFPFLTVMAVLAIASGTRLMMIVSGGFQAEWFNSPRGNLYAWSGVAAIAAFALAVAIERPLAGWVFAREEERAGAADEAVRAALARRIQRGGRALSALGAVLTVLLVVSAAGMGLARYRF